ncbi:regulator of G-protein signaling 12-like isoform X2 [Ptychodera flava]|uniref:regulator of G-protein signaling 12-like isoform X2 n=1 Tax=Ptychodera flava TaxID=63121 RepID=UPI00396A2846
MPVQVQPEPNDSTDTCSSTREVKLSKKASKKEDKKKKEKEKPKKGKDRSLSGESETTDENTGEKRRKSLLPWNRSKSTKKSGKADKKDKKEDVTPAASTSSIEDREKKGSTREGSTASTGSRRSSMASTDLNRFAKDASEGSESLERVEESSEVKEQDKFCRVILPDNSTTVIYARKGQSVRAALKLLCERRRIAIASLEVYDVKTNQMYALDQDLSTLASKEIQVENRVMFKVELPNKRVIGVKSKPNKAIIDVLNPIMSKYHLTLEGMVVHLNASPVQLELDIEVATLEGQRVIIEPYEKYAGRLSMARPPLPPNGRLRKAESVDSTLDQSSQSTVHIVDMRPAKSADGLHEVGKITANDSAFVHSNSTLSKFIRTSAYKEDAPGSQRQGAVRSGKAQTLTSTSTTNTIKRSAGPGKGVNSLRGLSDRRTVRSRPKLSSTEAKARAQHDRMDDQRGTTSNFELPEFLKVQGSKNMGANKLKRSPPVQKHKSAQWASKSASDTENVDDNHVRDSDAQRAALHHAPPRPHSTPPIRQLQTMDLSLQDGVLPTHLEADYMFGSKEGRLTPEFNDSGILGNSYREQNPPMDVSYLNRLSPAVKPALTKSKSLSRNRDDLSRLSPAVFNREPVNRSSPVVRFDVDNTEKGHNTTIVESISSEKLDDLDIDDLDTTITASEMPLPSPPSPKDVDTTYDWGEANYSPPPPLSSQERAALIARTTQPGSPPKQPPPIPPKPTLKGKKPNILPETHHDKRPDNLVLQSNQPGGSSNHSSTDISTSPLPSPSTHDLFFSPSPEEVNRHPTQSSERDNTISQHTPVSSRLDDDRSLGRSIMGDQYSILKNRQSRSRSGISVPSDSNNIIHLGKDADKLRITFV